MLGEETEKHKFAGHHQAKLEWLQRKEELRRLYADMYLEAKHLLERGKNVAISSSEYLSRSEIVFNHTRQFVQPSGTPLTDDF